ncbi:MAG: HD domain-containing protein [Syntrophales bacterium]|nr:HD domain-containing protein [Syntrophales bacterium]
MKCPGQDTRYWKPGAIFETACTKCGNPVEFFKDEATRRCKNCGTMLVNPKMDFGCAAYCKFAEQCLGGLPPGLSSQRDDLLKDRVAIEMKRYFKQDFKRIGHATKVARYADEIFKEEGGDPAVIMSAAYLHDIGIKEAERKYQSTAARYQEEEGPPIAREILSRLGAGEELIEEVCDIVGHHHHPKPQETINFKVLYDADLIVNMEEDRKDGPADIEKLNTLIGKAFLTEGGRKLAKSVLLPQGKISQPAA